MLITEIKNKKNLNKYDVDGIIFCYKKFHTFASDPLKKQEIVGFVDKIHNFSKKAILKIDKIIEESEVEELKKFLDFVITTDIDYYIFSDMVILYYFMEKHLTSKLIYSAKTLNCSYNDSLYFKSLDVAVMASNELSLKNLKDLDSLGNLVIDGYGFTNIFYSRRKLLSLFKQKNKKFFKIRNKTFFITEEKREKDYYPIIENNAGTFIFTPHKYCIYKELLELKNLFMFKIESFLISEADLFAIIAIYKKLIVGNINDELYQELINIDANISQEFLYRKSLILGDEDEKN